MIDSKEFRSILLTYAKIMGADPNKHSLVVVMTPSVSIRVLTEDERNRMIRKVGSVNLEFGVYKTSVWNFDVTCVVSNKHVFDEIDLSIVPLEMMSHKYHKYSKLVGGDK